MTSTMTAKPFAASRQAVIAQMIEATHLQLPEQTGWCSARKNGRWPLLSLLDHCDQQR
jgi:hypothetical protein